MTIKYNVQLCQGTCYLLQFRGQLNTVMMETTKYIGLSDGLISNLHFT